MSDVECRMSNVECRMSNVECRMSNVERRMSNAERRTPNAECRTSNAEHEAPDAFECRVRQRSTPPMQHGRTPPFRRTDRFAAGAAHPCDVRFSPRHPRGNRLYTLLRAALIQR
ncbi:LysR family transcriptional regulator [Burkholderia pseudomallei]|uniref:LysR family transcriptional regulator n=3 Tax=Burkholderia pseudomallei TaxID=28450 RepID=UPI0021800470